MMERQQSAKKSMQLLRERSEYLNQTKQDKIDREVKKTIAASEKDKKRAATTGFHTKSQSVIDVPTAVRTDDSPNRYDSNSRKHLTHH